jgi:hypothetical protein
MLGITVPDAIALGTLIIAVLAALRGGKAGEHAKRATPPDPPMAMIGGAIVDTMTLRDLTTAVQGLAAAMHASVEYQRHAKDDKMSVTLDRLLHELSERDDERARHGPRRR